ncbi:MAG: PAS domain-containing protein [Gemmatimonadota bacterium]
MTVIRPPARRPDVDAGSGRDGRAAGLSLSTDVPERPRSRDAEPEGAAGARGAADDDGPAGRARVGELQTALRESERRFRRLVEQIADAVFVIDLDGRFTDVNRRACANLGYTREHHLHLRLPEVEIALGAESVGDLVEEMRSGEFVTRDGVHRRREGSTFPVEVWAGLIEIGGEQRILAIARDLTDQCDTERALDESEERFRLMVEGSDQVFFFAHGPDHRLTHLSPSVEAVPGYSPHELLGQPFEVLHPGDPTDKQVQELTESFGPSGRCVRPRASSGTHGRWRPSAAWRAAWRTTSTTS